MYFDRRKGLYGGPFLFTIRGKCRRGEEPVFLSSKKKYRFLVLRRHPANTVKRNGPLEATHAINLPDTSGPGGAAGKREGGLS